VVAVLSAELNRDDSHVSATGDPMVARHLWNDRGTVTFSRHDEGREFLDLVAGQDESLAIEIEDEWWATTPRPFLLARRRRRRS